MIPCTRPKMLFIKTNFDLCTGCSICKLACSMTHNMGYNPRLAHLLIHHKRENLYHKPVVCNHCQNPYCMNVCPAKAYQKTDFGFVVIDSDRCVGCGICVQYCPEALVQISPETLKAVKCDMCNGNPQCVAACPTGALELIFHEDKREVSHNKNEPIDKSDKADDNDRHRSADETDKPEEAANE